MVLRRAGCTVLAPDSEAEVAVSLRLRSPAAQGAMTRASGAAPSGAGPWDPAAGGGSGAGATLRLACEVDELEVRPTQAARDRPFDIVVMDARLDGLLHLLSWHAAPEEASCVVGWRGGEQEEGRGRALAEPLVMETEQWRCVGAVFTGPPRICLNCSGRRRDPPPSQVFLGWPGEAHPPGLAAGHGAALVGLEDLHLGGSPAEGASPSPHGDSCLPAAAALPPPLPRRLTYAVVSRPVRHTRLLSALRHVLAAAWGSAAGGRGPASGPRCGGAADARHAPGTCLSRAGSDAGGAPPAPSPGARAAARERRAGMRLLLAEDNAINMKVGGCKASLGVADSALCCLRAVWFRGPEGALAAVALQEAAARGSGRWNASLPHRSGSKHMLPLPLSRSRCACWAAWGTPRSRRRRTGSRPFRPWSRRGGPTPSTPSSWTSTCPDWCVGGHWRGQRGLDAPRVWAGRERGGRPCRRRRPSERGRAPHPCALPRFTQDGIEVLEEAKRRWPEFRSPFVAVTADAFQETRDRCVAVCAEW